MSTGKTTPPPGLQKVSALIGGTVSELQRETRQRPQWPPKGGTYAGIAPGQWKPEAEVDDTGWLPEDCPVRPLGYDGEQLYFVDTRGQVFNTQGKALGVERMQILFAGHENFLCWAWPTFKGAGDKRYVDGWDTLAARGDLFGACFERGAWSPTDMVRGRGAWVDTHGRLILHCGDRLWLDGHEEDTGELDDVFYVRRPKSLVPHTLPVETAAENPAVALAHALGTWQFSRGTTDVLLAIGWIGVALMGAALDWRPSIFLIGDFGTGKSQLHALLKQVLGRAMISTTNATSAGLYQIVGHDALPICIDEIEGDDAPAQAQEIIKMARDAASGSVRIRGGADHKGVEFAARSAFLFSAINPPPINRASLSRLAVLQLRQLDGKSKPPVLEKPEEIGPKLLRRVADHFGEFAGLYDRYAEELMHGGHSSRGQKTFGTLLAAAHLLLGDAGMKELLYPVGNLTLWREVLGADAVPEVAGTEPNWLRCITAIFSAPVDQWNKGERRTVGQVLEPLSAYASIDKIDINEAREKLATGGLGLVDPGHEEDGGFEGFALAIPNGSRALNKLLEDTTWAGKGEDGGWLWALNQAPETIVRGKLPALTRRATKPDNRLSIAGAQKRCQFVGLEELRKYLEGQA